MEKTIVIDGKNIRFKSTGGSAIRYKAQFGKDFFTDVAKLSSLNKLKNKNDNELSPEDMEKIDFDFFYNLAQVFAKTANKEIPNQLDWLDEFDEFPIMDIIPELMELVTATLKTKKK